MQSQRLSLPKISPQWLIAGVLMLMMLVTRPHMLAHLQDASWAIFILLGFYVRSHIGFVVFMVTAIVIDLAVVEYTQIDNYCMTPAYPFIIPAYAVLWAAGQWLARQHQVHGSYQKTLLQGAFVAALAITICFSITNIGFYWFSEHFESMSPLAYANDVAKYLVAFMQTTFFYLAVAALMHVAVLQIQRLHGNKLAA